MEKRINDELATLTNVIVHTVPVERIFLFGSYAYGTMPVDIVVGKASKFNQRKLTPHYRTTDRSRGRGSVLAVPYPTPSLNPYASVFCRRPSEIKPDARFMFIQ